MNKRQVKKNFKNKIKSVQKGYGVILGSRSINNDNTGIVHYFKVGDVVEVIGIQSISNSVDCLDIKTGLRQWVSPHHIALG